MSRSLLERVEAELARVLAEREQLLETVLTLRKAGYEAPGREAAAVVNPRQEPEVAAEAAAIEETIEAGAQHLIQLAGAMGLSLDYAAARLEAERMVVQASGQGPEVHAA